jgi:class 3 adenylate cyclase
VAEIQDFVTGVRPVLDPRRVLATVLFTDIVGSTRLAAERGDTRWQALLADHNRIVRRQLDRFGGTEVKVVGDGFLATFDGPAQAVRCAVAIRDEVKEIGLEIRAGLHVGEVEVLPDDIAGLAVHIGARVSAIAGAFSSNRRRVDHPRTRRRGPGLSVAAMGGAIARLPDDAMAFRGRLPVRPEPHARFTR